MNTPVMVPGESYLIDAHEVTVNEYAAFLATNPTTAGQGSRCSWNDSFEPGWISSGAKDAADAEGNSVDDSCRGWLENQQTALRGNRAVACVDYCDAVAYCRWAGKHLCGKIGGGTLDVTSPDHSNAATDAMQSEWYAACSTGGTNLYPYGPTYMKGVCNDKGNDIEVAGTFAGCTGGPPDAFDMSGNVSEWTDECTSYGGRAAAGQNCLERGGAFWGEADDLTCGKDSKGMTNNRESMLSIPGNTTGFRCCM